MSNPIVVIPLTVTPSSGPVLDVQRSDSGIILEVVRGLNEVAAVRGQDDIIPGTAGRTLRNRVKDSREIELLGWVQGVGATEAIRLGNFRDLVDLLQAGFDPTKTVTLVATGEDSVNRTIVARVVPPMIWSPETVPGVRQLSVALISYAPDWT